MHASIQSLSVLFVFASFIPLQAAEPSPPNDLVLRDDVLRMSIDLLRRSRYGSDNYEYAAFILRDDAGRYSSQPFPALRQFRRAESRGPTPTGAVAIIHTHPERMERPSLQDQLESRRLGIPIYVLTRWAIYKVDPNTGNNVRVVHRTDWWNVPEKPPAPPADGILASKVDTKVDLPSRVMLRELTAPAGERP